MSIETSLGGKIYELRDVLKAGIVNDLVEHARANGGQNNLGLSRENLLAVRPIIHNSVDQIIDRSLHNILSALKD